MNLSEAEAHAQLGIPVPKGTPNRFLKRLVAKLSWFFLTIRWLTISRS